MLCAFATLWASVAAAPWESGNAEDVLLPQSGALALGVAVLLCLAFARTVLVKLPALMEQQAIDGSWRTVSSRPASSCTTSSPKAYYPKPVPDLLPNLVRICLFDSK